VTGPAACAAPRRPAPRRAAAAVAAASFLAVLVAGGCQGSDEDALSVVITLPELKLPPATKATLLVDYSGTGARLLGESGGPACAFLLPGVEGEFSDDRQGTLTIHASGPRATRGPAELAACRMKASEEGTTAAELASKLSIRVQAAEDAAGKPIDVSVAAARAGAAGGPGGAASRMSEDDIEQAQADAVKAAETITKAAREAEAANPAGANTDGANPAGAAGPAGMGGPGSAGPAGSGAPGAAARPAAPANIARAPAAAVPVAPPPPVVDNSAMPGGDRDPGYDDSPADDEAAPAYSLDFYVDTPGTFGALQLDVNHLGNGGGFIGRGDKVDCVPLVEAIVASNYLGERETKIGLISLQGIHTPAAIMRCGFRTRESLSPGSFLVEVTDASDVESKPIEPRPTVYIRSIVPRR
jgi:hypothetical protein